MNNRDSRTHTLRVICVGLALLIGMVLTGIGYSGTIQPGQKRTVAAGEKLKVKGIILSRTGETFVTRDLSRTDTTVVLTDATVIKTARKGLFRGGKKLDVTALLPGLILQVEGKGDAEGRLVAKEIRFKEEDLKAALTAFAQTSPVEDKTDKALREVAETDKRISSLDEYDVVKVVTVHFAVNNAELSKEAKAQLDELASRAPGAKNYTVEVQGFADSTGKFKYNLDLSRRRADSVVQYLTVKHNVPLRRITTPMGYGSTKGVGDETTPDGRAENRRVEVRILVNKGLSQ
jgi:OmpA-OmpF porin, OOP family